MLVWQLALLSCAGAAIPSRPVDHRYWSNSTHGVFMLTCTVIGSTTLIESTFENTKPNNGALTAELLPAYASRFCLTASALSGSPSWKVTFGLTLIVHAV